MVEVLIIDGFGIGYVAGKKYMVEPAEAKRLVDGNHAQVLSSSEPKKENAAAKEHGKAEKAVK